MFDQLKSTAFSMLGHFGERFRKKIDALRLLPALYHDAPSLETDSLKDLNFTAWLLDAKKKEWLSGWDPESTLPLMQPWAVNAYYDPTNIVFIPPGLMNIFRQICTRPRMGHCRVYPQPRNFPCNGSKWYSFQ